MCLMYEYEEFKDNFKRKALNFVVRSEHDAPDSVIDEIIKYAPKGSLANKHLDKDNILSRGHKIAVLRKLGKVIGYVIVSIIPEYNGYKNCRWIEGIEVFPKYRGYGLGKILLDIAVDEFRANWLTVSVNNTTAIHLYEEAKFKEYKRNGSSIVMKQ